MNNVMLGKKELVVVLVILVLCCIYFIIDYFLNRKTTRTNIQEIVENFANEAEGDATTAAIKEINQHQLDIIKDKNSNIFKNEVDIVKNKKKLVENEIMLANRFKYKKFNLKHIIAVNKRDAVKKVTDNQESELSYKFKALIGYDNSEKGRVSYLKQIKTNFNNNNLKLDSLIKATKNKQVYVYMKSILEGEKAIYEDMYKYYEYKDETETTDMLRLQYIVDTYNKKNNPSTTPTSTPPANETLNDFRKDLAVSEELFKTNIEKIENDGNRFLNYLDNNSSINRDVSQLLVKLINTKLQLLRKLSVRRIGFNLPDMIVTLTLIGELKDAADKVTSSEESEFIKEQSNSIIESNKIASEIISLYDKEEDILNEIKLFFETSKSSFFIEENEFKYFNTVDNNTQSMLNFCKKIRKMDRPKNNTQLFKRLTGEFINKKNEQINTLNGKIDTIMNDMTVKDNYNQDLYKLRTSEDAQKQINAIEKAKDNIDNMGKVKINVT